MFCPIRFYTATFFFKKKKSTCNLDTPVTRLALLLQPFLLYPISIHEIVPILRFTVCNYTYVYSYWTVTIQSEGDDVLF